MGKLIEQGPIIKGSGCKNCPLIMPNELSNILCSASVFDNAAFRHMMPL